MPDYSVVVCDNDPVETNNLIEVVDTVKRLEKEGKRVLVFSGSYATGQDFIRRVKDLYR